ncbi:hypothetical protein EVAR_68660_1 [Eumeta japonica]|uniref:Secreted protein n=1 Tax=Eumeta variegata TaxID=151549 RepID=A0A4C1TAV6_EUMVA|nr:hypothetical protein EVAR_68660_1 [Eumeta japonica]
MLMMMMTMWLLLLLPLQQQLKQQQAPMWEIPVKIGKFRAQHPNRSTLIGIELNVGKKYSCSKLTTPIKYSYSSPSVSSIVSHNDAADDDDDEEHKTTNKKQLNRTTMLG